MSFGRLLLAWTAMAIGAVIILLITLSFFRPLAGSGTRTLLFVSAVLVVLTVIFELAIGRLVDGKSWAEPLGNYAIWRGRLWPLLLLLIALTPFIWGRWLARAPARAHDHPT